MLIKKLAALAQSVELTNLENIKPPLRLSFVPYLAGYIEKNPDYDNWINTYNYGLDLKYGINESFTLDMTLIPDFGHVQSDDRILDLSPFETYYNEKRPFFTEGTELFDKGGIFYSRRIGSTPIKYDDIEDDYDENNIISNPDAARLINATKLSGKTNGKLGIGLFNAMTANTYAKVIDTNGVEKKILTQPFTNYNMLVLDQSLKNNSYISLYNTNVYRGQNEYTANVSGTEFKIENKKNSYAINGLFNISQKYYPVSKPEFGYKYNINAGKISGNFKFNIMQNVESDTYDPNDMGFLYHNNQITNTLVLRYNIYEPFWKVFDWYNYFYIKYSSLYAPRKYTSFNLRFNSNTTFKNHLSVGFYSNFRPVEMHDYFEPRSDNKFFVRPSQYSLGMWISPDYRKKFVVDCDIGFWRVSDYNQNGIFFAVEPRFRVNDKLLFLLEIDFDIENNDIGYVTDSTDNNNNELIIFGKRDLKTLENTLEANYNFNNKLSLSFRLRHYWMTGKYKEFFDLEQDGYLSNNSYYENNDFNYNAFNIDMVFTWDFAPGSEMIVVWKNAIYGSEDEIINNYFDNFKNTIELPAINSFSIKLMYYLDYQYLKKLKKNK
ncbi:MAG: DUF5916 domain-containing protein [Bacteroidales bacterium]|nr:DUF5916 domain-containing protein [Bacteroidales bacterium]